MQPWQRTSSHPWQQRCGLLLLPCGCARRLQAHQHLAYWLGSGAAQVCLPGSVMLTNMFDQHWWSRFTGIEMTAGCFLLHIKVAESCCVQEPPYATQNSLLSMRRLLYVHHIACIALLANMPLCACCACLRRPARPAAKPAFCCSCCSRYCRWLSSRQGWIHSGHRCVGLIHSPTHPFTL